MLYAVVDSNKKIVHGPMMWTKGSFTRFFFENEIREILPVTPPTENMVVGDFKIMITEDPFMPVLDEPYEQFVGPFWTVTNEKVIGYFEKAPLDIESSKGKIKETVVGLRYNKEVAGVDFTLGSETVRLDTSRGARETLIMKAMTASDGGVYSFKFNIGFRNVTKADLSAMIVAVASHIQAAFDWEAGLVASIDAAVTVDDLKLVQMDLEIEMESNNQLI